MNRSSWDMEHMRAAFVSLTIHATIFLAILVTTSTVAPSLIQLDVPAIQVSWISLSAQERGHARRPVGGGNEKSAEREGPPATAPENAPVSEGKPAPPVAAWSESLPNAAAVVTHALSPLAERGGVPAAESEKHPGSGSFTPAEDAGSSSSERIGRDFSYAVPRYGESVRPSYPRSARVKGYEGVVLLCAEVHVDGRVGALKIKKSSGHSILDKSAYDAVLTWKFEPGKRMGKPVSMWVDIPVKFVLRDG